MRQNVGLDDGDGGYGDGPQNNVLPEGHTKNNVRLTMQVLFFYCCLTYEHNRKHQYMTRQTHHKFNSFLLKNAYKFLRGGRSPLSRLSSYLCNILAPGSRRASVPPSPAPPEPPGVRLGCRGYPTPTACGPWLFAAALPAPRPRRSLRSARP